MSEKARTSVSASAFSVIRTALIMLMTIYVLDHVYDKTGDGLYTIAIAILLGSWVIWSGLGDRSESND